jgi:hypothetical protein
MKVNVEFGYFRFFPTSPEELVRFQKLTDIKLVRVQDFFTFEPLSEIVNYSIIGKPLGLGLAIKTGEWENPGELMRANQTVYSLPAENVVPLLSITTYLDLIEGQEFLTYQQMLAQPGGLLGTGLRLVSYSGFIDLKNQRLNMFDYEAWPL